MPAERGQSHSNALSDGFPALSDFQLFPLLKRVSRAFYLSIRVLPRRVREPVGLAYILARTADSIADTAVASADHRLEDLRSLRPLLTSTVDQHHRPRKYHWLTGPHLEGAERDLLESAPSALAYLRSLPSLDRELVSTIVLELTHGMEFDLTRLQPTSTGEVKSIESTQQLDSYTYLVAGCVGKFWTLITAAHTPALSHWDQDQAIELGVRFGKALQMTNILRDVPSDLARGRCYLPSEWLDDLGLAPQDLLDAANSSAARPALVRGMEMALGHFTAAEQYVSAIPRRCFRLRLAAIWPLLMGLATLEKVARTPGWLDSRRRPRVSRAWVYRMLALSLVAVHSNQAVSFWVRVLTNRVQSALRRHIG